MRFQCRRVPVRALVSAAVLACSAGAIAQTIPASKPVPATLTPEQQRYHDIYKELVEINTTHSAGDTTKAARAMEKRLADAGFAASDMQVIEPFPKKGNLVLRYKGTGAKQPVLLLAHIDVVEAKRDDWKTDPFKLQETDGYFTARGSIDDKAMASAFVSVLRQLKQEGFKPSRDIILALTTDEERGDVPSNGAYWIVNNKPELVKAEFGINEGGGGELRGGKPVLHRIQVAEKMYTTYELEVRDVGGHSSVPTKMNPVYALSAALDRLGAYQFPVKLADDMRSVGTGKPDQAAIDRLSAIPFYNAQLRTTCVATMVNAGHAENALPQSAKATVNCRILPHDDPADIDRQLKQVIGNDKIAVRYINKPLASPASPLNGDLVKTVDTLTQQMWNVPVIPAMSTGATDSRFMRNAGIPMYGVSGLFTEPSDLRTHGLDERIEIARLYDGRDFLYRLVKQLAE